MATFHVPLKKTVDDSYDIQIGFNLFSTLIEDLKNGLFPKANKLALITDSNVLPLYASNLILAIKEEGFTVELFSMPAGEHSKTRETKIRLENEMLDKGFGRDSAVIALGGGVVSDLAGFLAGTFGRGIPFANYSTTLLSAADASVGGKTAVDTPHATNLIGLFNQPVKVYIDIATWSTLPDREVRAGLAETIKHACLADAEFFAWLEANITKIASAEDAKLDAEACEFIAEANCRIKYDVVSRDEKEANLRQVLNLGHTAGRAMETLFEYQLLHGECVAVGLSIQALLANKLELISDEDHRRVDALIALCGLPTEVPEEISTEELVEKMYTDKKVRSGQIRFVLMDGIGAMKTFENGSYTKALADDFLISTINEYRTRQSAE
ncbi:3-dehydroquinate synthase [Lentisphaera araneosa HTCC2155]|jgi:3-dehydroquinate synthase|uniref:3-dehydroquinate synthase n=1 Tax=Lentisphaera araneosa HTCC2155 TaxID=313628 RepID=A6DP20_9BACT|nr:3-dehydroquinate synthase [Lentisphaera araneosa]EDM26552.1 3-dehydroquinate synthase [Lentisphaera araneosa HTCC2155]